MVSVRRLSLRQSGILAPIGNDLSFHPLLAAVVWRGEATPRGGDRGGSSESQFPAPGLGQRAFERHGLRGWRGSLHFPPKGPALVAGLQCVEHYMFACRLYSMHVCACGLLAVRTFPNQSAFCALSGYSTTWFVPGLQMALVQHLNMHARVEALCHIAYLLIK